MKRLDFINKRLREKKNKTRAYINNVDEEMVEYYRVFAKQIEICKEKLYGAYYQPYRLWTGGKAIKDLHKITSMSRKDIKSWLAKQALWQVHIPPPKEIHHPHYDVTKSNAQHQFDLL